MAESAADVLKRARDNLVETRTKLAQQMANYKTRIADEPRKFLEVQAAIEQIDQLIRSENARKSAADPNRVSVEGIGNYDAHKAAPRVY